MPGIGGVRRRMASSRAMPVSDDEYLARYEAEVRAYVRGDGQGTTRGQSDLLLGVWGSYRSDAQRSPWWEVYRHRLRAAGLWTGTFWAMNPDGSWRPWNPDELEA